MQRASAPAGKIRIIGGKWRRRTLAFDGSLGIRPTPNRTRETLFNWLSPTLPGARCLDAFAGSGALGFEAASRGAIHVDLIDVRPEIAERLRAEVVRLDADRVHIQCADALGWLARPGLGRQLYDVVFLDPPYDSELLVPCLEQLGANGWLSPDALVYLETGRAAGMLELPLGWEVVREKRAGRVRYHLASRARRLSSTR